MLAFNVFHSFPRGTWERHPRRSASSDPIAVDAERPDWHSHAERGNEFRGPCRRSGHARPRSPWVLAAVLLLGTGPALAADDPAPISFREQVAPILVRRCVACHNPRKSEGGLDLGTFATLRRGGDIEGEAILEPGDPEASHLIAVLGPAVPIRMPYKLPPLPDAEVATLTQWVAQGAKFDGPSESETPIASLVDPLQGLPEVASRAGTVAPIAAVAFAPDGRRIAAAKGRDVLILDAGDGSIVATLADHPGPVTALAYTPDGRTLLAIGGRAGQFGSVIAWDVEGGTRRLDVRGHTDAILAAALAPDGSTLATGGYDRLVVLWSMADGSIVRTLSEHTDAIHGLAFAPDGKSLATASADRTLKLWEVATGKRIASLSDATAELYATAFADDGRLVLSGGVDRTLRAYAIGPEGVRLARSAIAHEAPILKLLTSADGTRLVSSGEDRTVRTWEIPALRPLAGAPPLADWPLGIALDQEGRRLAVGRYDGGLDLLDPAVGKTVATLLTPGVPAAVAPPPKAELVRNASLNPPEPRAAGRGQTVRVRLGGNGVGQAAEVVFDDPKLVATLVATDKPDPNATEIDLNIADDARAGVHRFWVRTPLGVPGSQSFAVWDADERPEVEPNDRPAEATPAPGPAVLAGVLDKPGDRDSFALALEAGDELVLRDQSRGLGSSIDFAWTLIGPDGAVVAGAEAARGDSELSHRALAGGRYVLQVADAQMGGSGNHFYRIVAGHRPRIAVAFPLGVPRGGSATLAVDGSNLDRDSVELSASAGQEAGTFLAINLDRTTSRLKAVVADGPQSVEDETNDDPGAAGALAVPGGVSGRLDRPGDADLFRFEARRGEPIVLEVFAGRLGSRADAAIEILDADGRPVPMAVLRPIYRTFVAFRNHASTGRNIRLTEWSDLAVGDHVLIGRELTKLAELPRNPDDDAVFWGLGHPRNNTGERVAFLGTTPEHHPLGQPIDKVEIHPPGATFPPGGAAPVTLYHRNDDGGPGLGDDPSIRLDPPADGTYLVRVEDARGLGGPDHEYHLVARPPAPDFRLKLSTDNPNVPRGGTVVVTATIERRDGFDGPVAIEARDLPPGIVATAAQVEPGATAADFALTAADDAPAFTGPTWKVVARAEAEGGAPIVREVDPGGKSAGWITVTPRSDLVIAATPGTVRLRPGESAEVVLVVARSAAFAGRVPIEVRNLPAGVQVQNIGLNGVLITEKETRRTIVLRAEPWAPAAEHPFFAVGRVEASGIESGAPPLTLVVEPAGTP